MSFGLVLSGSHNSMIDQVEELLRAGSWLGPAVLGALVFRVLSQQMAVHGEEFAGAIMLGTSALVLTAIGVKLNEGKHAALAPVAFVAMFVASWSML
jgi:hypothetical protein